MSVSLLVTIVSCSEESNPSLNLSDERTAFIDGKSHIQQKKDFGNLSFSSKKILWISKIIQLESVELSNEHLRLISSMKSLILQSGSEENLTTDSEFQRVGIALSKITPDEDFIQMFVRLENYHSFDASRFQKFESTITAKLEIDFIDKKIIAGNSNRMNGTCNCDWTCGDGDCDTSYDCEEGGSCGFLWMFDCVGRDEQFC